MNLKKFKIEHWKSCRNLTLSRNFTMEALGKQLFPASHVMRSSPSNMGIIKVGIISAQIDTFLSKFNSFFGLPKSGVYSTG